MITVDPFTVEVIKSGLITASEEMFISLARTSRNATIFEILDHACGMTDASGQLVSQSNGVAVFCGVLSFAVDETLEKYGPNKLTEGDIIITNDPYKGGGTHLCDVSLVAPIFFRNEIIAFSVSKAHWADVGGKDVGSQTTNSTELFQEGIQFPALKLHHGGVVDENVSDFILSNVRMPEMVLGDMKAQAASLSLASKRLTELCNKYGVNVVRQSMTKHIEHGEATARSGLARLPKGEFYAEDWVDDDGISDEPIRVRAKVHITDEEFVVDYSGTDKQCRGPSNCTLHGTIAGARLIFKAMTDPQEPMSAGCFAPLKVIVPEGTVFNPRRPAPTSAYWETLSYAVDLVWKALADHLPRNLSAGHSLSACGTQFAGRSHESGEIFVTNESLAGGWGAAKDKDGENSLVVSVDGECHLVPAEIFESRYPIIIEKQTLNVTKAGCGERRGGFGLLKRYRVTDNSTTFTGIFSRAKYPPWGIHGGNDGSVNYFVIRNSEGKEIIGHRAAMYPLHMGDTVTAFCGTGGGYGSPIARDPDLVLQDFIDGFIDKDTALNKYGVQIDEVKKTIDYKTTERIREELGRLS